VNNSANPATINGGVRWQAGGGSAYTLAFGGPGNWIVNNYLVNDNPSSLVSPTKDLRFGRAFDRFILQMGAKKLH
jgi:hypothetical protein